jgi:16S rRNA (uracil1498-N3)-methyltransferase
MNLILVNSLNEEQRISGKDRRAVHIRKVLMASGKTKAYVGVPDGPIGLAEFEKEADYSIRLKIDWHSGIEVVPPHPLVVLVGLCRPQTCRKILRELPVLGVKKAVFFQSDKGEPSYAKSALWKSDEWKDQLFEGMEQSFCTHEAKVLRAGSIDEAIEMGGHPFSKLALDPYEADSGLMAAEALSDCALAIGTERGWSDRERVLLRKSGWAIRHLGPRIMRTETAVVAGCSILTSAMRS